MASRYRHEDVEAVPKGWKVRTVKAGAHRVRVAFPPGRKVKGSGRLVSVLHPLSGSNPCANPCSLRSANPAELLVMGANPPRKRSAQIRELRKQHKKALRHAAAARQAYGRAETYEQRQKAEEDLRIWTDKERQLWDAIHGRRNPAELLVMGANPRVEVVHSENPPVEDIVEEFTGAEAKWIDVYNEPHMARGRYAQLAPLIALVIKPSHGGQVVRIGASDGVRQSFTADEKENFKKWAAYWNGNPPMIVSDSTSRQLYFVDGRCQDITPMLDQFGAEDRGEGIVVLGQAREIHYWGRKENIGDDEPRFEWWRHKHGEEDGALPTVLFDTRNKRLLYEGGNYRVEGPWIHN